MINRNNLRTHTDNTAIATSFSCRWLGYLASFCNIPHEIDFDIEIFMKI